MGSAAQRIPTFEELYQAIEALPPGVTGEILEPGIIRTMGRPGGLHRYGARLILHTLGGDDAGVGGRGWWLEQEAEIRFASERLAVPDLSGWHLGEHEQLPPAFVYENPILRLPNWCCEVLSPSTEEVDRDIKLPLYAGAGVEWIWLVDPEARRVEVHHSSDGAAKLVETIEAAAKRAIPPFMSVVDMARWWLPPRTER